MPERTDWEARARGILHGTMAQKGVTYAQLVDRLKALGVEEDEHTLRAKVGGGTFTAAFFLQCLAALELRRLVIDAYGGDETLQ